MPIIDRTLSLVERLEQFRILYRYYSLEMQLIWLTDIITAFCYEHLSNKKIEDRLSKSTNTSINTNVIYDIFKEYDLEFTYIKTLFNYRNAYVHKGPKYAIADFTLLRNKYKSELAKIADYFGLQLNWDFVIYDNLADQAKAYINMKWRVKHVYIRRLVGNAE